MKYTDITFVTCVNLFMMVNIHKCTPQGIYFINVLFM